MKKKKKKDIIKEFFQKLDSNIIIERTEIKKEIISLEIKSKNPEILIGKQGKILKELEYLLGKILRKSFKENIFIDLDINQYKKKKIKYLTQLAQTTADQVSLEKREISLPPMSSYERRIVHLVLSKRNDVQTESKGEEPERKVVIKPFTK